MAIPGDAIHAMQWIAHQYRRLDTEAAEVLTTRGDMEGFNVRMQAAGRLITTMPLVIRGLLDGTAESASVLDAVSAMADEAERYLQRDDYHAIGMFLEPHGAADLEPNHLERLIAAHSIKG